MKINKIFSILLTLLIIFPSCDLLEPENDNHRTLESVYAEPNIAEGLLQRAYINLPTNSYWWDDVATDDAVTNNQTTNSTLNNYRRIATGEWSAIYNPQNFWDYCLGSIMYINYFMDVVNDIPWRWNDDELKNLYKRRLIGEAYALRGLQKFFLLRNHAGIGTNNELLGIPIYNEFVENEADFSKPRASFTESLNSAYADLDESLKYLPMDYGNLAALANLPPGFSEVTDIAKYNAAFGDYSLQRMSGRHAKAMKARLALLAASPAFNIGNDAALWQTAANYTAELLNDIGGISGMDPLGFKFFLKASVDDALLTTGDKKDIREMLWREPYANINTYERDNFPPTLYGSGRINPTQNLVDAFPMKNGFPITDSQSGYNPANPYDNRDPRLALYIVTNGSKVKNTTINTGVGGTVDGLDAQQTSTRTGYYLRKLLREEVNANPSSLSTQYHIKPHIRYTELYLNYAEAANEAWGPDGKGAHAYSAKDVIAAIRKRAGITQPDAYLASVTDKTTMRALIRNERRLELCFEDFRFWDLRRWKEDLTIPARGVRVEGASYSYFTVEERAYNNSYMIYGPIPDVVVTRFNLIQNKGW